MTRNIEPRGLAFQARPLLVFIACTAVAMAAFGCAGTIPPRSEDSPTRAEVPPGPPYSLTGYVLIIEPVADETASREVQAAVMEDFRHEIRSALAGSGLFADVRAGAAGAREPYLLLRPVLLLERITRPEDRDPMVEMEVRFELRVSGSRGLVWRGEYSERSPQEILYQSPFRERQRILAMQAIRLRILASLRRDLTRFLAAY